MPHHAPLISTIVVGLVLAFVFGALAIGLIQSLSWEGALYALLSLTLIRVLPVALALLRTRMAGVTVLFAGWFGPRGLASIVLGLIVVAAAPRLAGPDPACRLAGSSPDRPPRGVPAPPGGGRPRRPRRPRPGASR